MTTMANRIHLQGEVRYEEAIAGGTITPGHLIEIFSSSGLKVRVHSTAGGRAERYFATENALQGLEPGVAGGHTVDTNYVITDLVQGILCQRGTVVSARLKAGVSYAIGDKLVSAGDGTLEKASSLASAALEKDDIAVVLEALDLSASGAVATRCPVRII